MNTEFCTCKNYSCKLHPLNHDQGCNPCMKKNLNIGELPSCFFRAVSEELRDVKVIKDSSYEAFAKLILGNKE
ncbi:DUF6485 family protein [Clostridium sp. OS1-26]|uniref:DUF6485 family protein n=1 Tax=Clostridium sp. OS1-26 TaxID=3070681 RepID=UPI0027E01698|nr:DUF6485 family protein [Clostridium sp. OS1-26]WML34514.1 DUF6485 family protein [Clostridium sp. OS1-26]